MILSVFAGVFIKHIFIISGEALFLSDEVNLGWNWYDSDTEKMKAKDPELKSRFKKIMKLAAVQGKGYLFFPDKANRQRPQMYKDLGLDRLS